MKSTQKFNPYSEGADLKMNISTYTFSRRWEYLLVILIYYIYYYTATMK